MTPTRPLENLADWKQFWGSPESGSVNGQVRLYGGNVLAKFAAAPNQLTPDDFRLREGSAGYNAGKDGKDLGADIDLVGPGAAYERWKKTAEYQAWLKDSGQLDAEAPQPELGAFVLLGGKGVAERKFDTLAEAVLRTTDGDTIEVRGNGPFVTEPLEINARMLTIRAADGARPVIRLSQQASQAFEAMLLARGNALVLEGLELQRLDQREWAPGEKAPYIVSTRTAALHLANCRFRQAGSRYSVCVSCFAPIRVRNCEFLGFAYGVEGGAVTGRERVMENCIHVGGVALDMPPRGAEVRLMRNTLVSHGHLFLLHDQFPLEESKKYLGADPLQVEASANVLDGRTLLAFLQDPASLAGGAVPEPADAEGMLRSLLTWRDRGNLYREGSASVNWCVESLEPKAAFPLDGKAPADWKRLLNDPQAEVTEGRLRYSGGDILARADKAPEKLTPQDFRLRSDSAGYRAGPDGKDLGADVDLVGPGAAYVRWKTTPEYQQWLEEAGQLK